MRSSFDPVGHIEPYLSAAPKVMSAEELLDTHDENTDSTQAATAKLASVAKIERSCSEGASADKQLVVGLERILTQMIGGKSAITTWSQRRTGFYSPRQPSISLKRYLFHNIHTFFNCSKECYVLALVYINRIIKLHPDISVCNLSVHRLSFFAVMLATKFHDDEWYSNTFYAKLAGLPIKEMNMLELKFLKILDFKMLVEPKEYQFYHGLICQASSSDNRSSSLPFDEPEAEP